MKFVEWPDPAKTRHVRPIVIIILLFDPAVLQCMCSHPGQTGGGSGGWPAQLWHYKRSTRLADRMQSVCGDVTADLLSEHAPKLACNSRQMRRAAWFCAPFVPGKHPRLNIAAMSGKNVRTSQNAAPPVPFCCTEIGTGRRFCLVGAVLGCPGGHLCSGAPCLFFVLYL